MPVNDADAIVPSTVARGAPSSFVKYGWASHRFDRLKTLVREFEASKPAVIRSTFRPRRPGYDLTFHVDQQPPDEFALLAGDVVGGLRDSLDHLIFELTEHCAPGRLPATQPGWPVCTRRSQGAMTSAKGRVNRASGEWKIAGLPREAQRQVRRYQPFHRRHGDGPHVRHPLWILDELRNIDRHRRLGVVLVSGSGYRSTVTPLRDLELVRRWTPKRLPRDGAVIERVWLSPGATEADLRVDARADCVVCLDEPTAYAQTVGLIPTLDFLARQVATVLTAFHQLQSDRARAYMEAGPFRET
jgi:hypothetical protein